MIVAADETGAALPAAPVLSATPTGPFTVALDWPAVPGAEGYEVWVRYGVGVAEEDPTIVTADWDRLAVVRGDGTGIIDDGLNVGKTFGYRVRAFNGAGDGPFSAVVDVQTPTDLPAAPVDLRTLHPTYTSITLVWFDQADNETGWGSSLWSAPVQAQTPGPPPAPPQSLTASPSRTDVTLRWVDASADELGFLVERSLDGGTTWDALATVAADSTRYRDSRLARRTTYLYRVRSYNENGASAPSNEVRTTTR